VLPPPVVTLFDELWSIYPNQDARLAAMKAWVALNPSVELAGFIVAHVRVRVAAGWARDNPTKFIPQLRTFLEGKRWTDRRAVQSSAQPAAVGLEGWPVMRSCPECGDTQEGRVSDGVSAFPPCPRCARAGDVGVSGAGKVAVV